VIPAPANTIALTAPQTDGTFWTLSGTKTTKTITRIDVDSGHVRAIVGVDRSASDIVESASGVLALGLGALAGAVNLRQVSNGASITTVPTAYPVTRVAASEDGTLIFALQQAGAHSSVAEIGTQSDRIVRTVPVPASTMDIIPSGSGAGFWVLLPAGEVEQFATAGTQPVTEFSTGAAAARLALSPNGRTLYVLRVTTTVANVAVVKLTTQSVQTVLPAPANSVDMTISLDGRQLYAAASPPGVSTIQAFALPG
jgi:hypothetical protein